MDGSSQYLKLRDASANASGDRNGVQGIDFVRTTAAEAFGDDVCADWRLTTNSGCGLDIYRKQTDPNLGSVYDGNVIEFDQDGDVNVVKVGGLKINNAEVVTKSYTDGTFAAIGVEQSVSDLSTTSSDHGTRITTIEGAGYATTSQLSLYATASSLGTTNDTVGGINTRVNTLENAGYVTSSGLSGYNYATQGYVATAVDILNNTNIGATASSGASAGVTVTDKASGTGVDFNFTIPPGADGNDGVTPTIAVTTTQGTAGGDASVSASTSGSTTTLAFTIPPGATGADATLGNLTGLTMSHNATIVDKRSVTTTANYRQSLNYTQYASVAQGGARDPDNARGLWVGNMTDENDGSPSGANFIAFTDSLTFYGNSDRTSYGDALSFTSNTDKLKYDGTEFSKLLHINSGGDVGIGTTNPGYKLDVNGTGRFTGSVTAPTFSGNATSATTAGSATNQSGGTVSATTGTFSGDITCSGKLNLGTYAVGQGYMTSRTITLGDNNLNYGGGSGWNTNTAALMFECADNTEMAVHDSGTRIASLMYFEGGSTNRITIGRNMGWGAISQVKMNGNITASGGIASGGTVTAPGLNINWTCYMVSIGVYILRKRSTNKIGIFVLVVRMGMLYFKIRVEGSVSGLLIQPRHLM